MDFLDPNKKRSHRLKLLVGYILVAVAISLGALVLLFMSSGYGIDDGKIIQKGLVFFNSRPGGSQVTVEGVYNKTKEQAVTDTRMELKEGRYKVAIESEGYRGWYREFNVEGGLVERMVYPFLFPQQLQTTNLKSYSSTPTVASSSPSRQWFVVMQPDKFGTFDVFNANEPEKPPTPFSIPDGILSPGDNRSLEVIEWANDNSNFLIKHTYNDKTEFAVINREKPSESFNITTLTGQQPYEVTLKDKKIDELYLHMSKDGLLQLVNTKTKALTPLAGKVFAYKSHGDDMLVYVTTNDKNQNLNSVKILTNEKTYTLRELPINTNYVVDAARFDNNWYIVVGAGSANRAFVYKNPLDVLASNNPDQALFARTLLINNPQFASFSANTRNIAVQSGQEFAVYDAETDRQYRYDVPDVIDSKVKAEWMDGHRLTTSTDKTVLVFDFDGTNYQKLMSINPQLPVAFDRDYDYALAVKSNDDKTATLTQTRLFVRN